MNSAALNRIKQKKIDHLLNRGAELQNMVYETHENAPRTGHWYNRNREKRSKPGHPPAPESERLLGLIRDPGLVIVDENHVRQVVNYLGLEYGTMWEGSTVKPRPMGRIVVEEFKMAVKGSPLGLGR